MLRTSLVCVLALGGCVNDGPPEYVPEEPGPPSQMIRTRTMAGELPVVGIDSDRAGGMWIAYSKAMGGYYAPDDVRLVHVDKHGAKTAEFRFADTYADILGIAFDGHAVWINVTGATGTDGAYVRAIDAVTGLEVARHTVESGISDLEVDDARGELLMSSVFDRVIALDLATGAETWREQLRATVPNYEGVQAAIALTDTGQMWIASRFWAVLELRDASRVPIATYTENVTDDHHRTNYQLFLAWDTTTQQVIAAAENQISWLSIRGGTP
jgi:hypothetical protein